MKNLVLRSITYLGGAKLKGNFKVKIEIPHWSHIDIPQLTELYRQAQWLEAAEERDIVLAIVQHTYAFAVAYEQNKIVGMGRVISDGVSDAYIQDVYVDQTYRGKGIGKMIIDKLVAHLKENKIMWIGLIGNPGTDKFYQPLGFERMIDYIPMKYRIQ